MVRTVLTWTNVAFLAVALCCGSQDGSAQTQPQGTKLDSPAPMPSSPPPPKAGSPKTKRADCMSQGKGQGLKGRELTKFVKECVAKST
jgi:hypothetical protein